VKLGSLLTCLRNRAQAPSKENGPPRKPGVNPSAKPPIANPRSKPNSPTSLAISSDTIGGPKKQRRATDAAVILPSQSALLSMTST